MNIGRTFLKIFLYDLFEHMRREKRLKEDYLKEYWEKRLEK